MIFVSRRGGRQRFASLGFQEYTGEIEHAFDVIHVVLKMQREPQQAAACKVHVCPALERWKFARAAAIAFDSVTG